MDIGDDVLCPGLYRRLRAIFGEVRVSNQGERWVARPVYDAGEDRYRYAVTQRGENYNVNCPFCGDRRHRLSVHHMYGQLDPMTGQAMTWLANCFNDTACLSGRGVSAQNARMNLELMLFGPMPPQHRSMAFPVKLGKRVERDAVVPPPGELIRVDQLPVEHKARRYLIDRRFDPDSVGRDFGVAYCVEANCQSRAADRLVVPIVRNGHWVSWQARFIGETNWKRTPKYFTCPGSSVGQYLYNDGPHAYRRGIVVVVEGVTNVWRLGAASVATFGKQLTHAQSSDLIQAGVDRRLSVVFAYDDDIPKDDVEATKIAAKDVELDRKISEVDTALRRAGGRAIRIRLPAGQDAARYGRRLVWQMIYSRLARAGVDLSEYVNANLEPA